MGYLIRWNNLFKGASKELLKRGGFVTYEIYTKDEAASKEEAASQDEATSPDDAVVKTCGCITRSQNKDVLADKATTKN